MISSGDENRYSETSCVAKDEQTGQLTSCSVSQRISRDVKVLPHDQRLDGAHVETFEGIIHTETVFASVLADLVKVLLDEFLLLDEFDILKRFAS